MGRRRSRHSSHNNSAIGAQNHRPEAATKFMFLGAGQAEFLTVDELAAGKTPGPYEFAAQCLGIVDAADAEVYQGDILELVLGDGTGLDTKFRSSNVGKAAVPEIANGAVSVVAFMPRCGAPFDECARVYIRYDGKAQIKRLHGVDIGFPARFCSWGAVCIASALGYLSDRRALADVEKLSRGETEGTLGREVQA